MIMQEKGILGENFVELKKLIKRAEARQKMKSKYKELNLRVKKALLVYNTK